MAPGNQSNPDGEALKSTGNAEGRDSSFVPQEDSVDMVDLLLDSLVILAQNKKRVAGFVATSTILAVILALVLKPYYTATAKMLPPQQSQSISAALLSQLGPLAGLIGSQVKTPYEVYTAILKVDPVADAIIQKHDLKSVYGVKTFVHARKQLGENTQITASREGILTVSVEDYDKKRAADLANAYVDELSNLMQRVAVTEAGQRRQFFESQLVKAKDALADAEVEMKKTSLATGMIQPEGQAKVTIEAVARLRGEITAKTVQLQSMRSFATEQNPALIRGERELASLRSQLAQLEGQEKSVSGSALLSAKDVPSAGLEYVRRLREVKYQETVYELLAKQVEIAKIDEAKEAGFVQVLQRATEPELKSGPYRTGIVLGTFMITSLLSLFWALLQAWFRLRPISVQHRELLRTLRYSLKS